MKPSVTRRIYHDPLHGAILLDSRDPTEHLLIQLIDTPAFQRLRRIRQLGPASLTFHGAEASRFTHSLGVMTIARRAFDRLSQLHPVLIPYRPVVLCAALLHDIGHGPFSHTGEELFGIHHETWTRRILRETVVIRQLIDGFDPELLDQIEQVYLKQHPIPALWQLVTSQLDCDRLDYLMRDSYFTGTSYGRLDLDRILMSMEYDPITQQLIVVQKGMTAVEHYLIVRSFMYTQVYNHAKNLAASWGLERAFQRAREHLATGELWADEVIRAWLGIKAIDPIDSTSPNQPLSLHHYLAADDGVMYYHLQRWQYHSDPILADLCRRFIHRDLLKAMDLSHYGPNSQNEMLQRVFQWLEDIGLAPSYYAGLRISVSSGYTLYQRGINILTEKGLQEITDLSPLVQALVQPLQKTWLIYPRDIENHLENG
ncbi:MAG: HD domain-containing protein [Synechococcales bacterium]|nr:HD domain-containing protein [Cyanobacteria bacterium REEB444]MEB3126465.1 HD domain-containing protein [Synechococcales bacterium]